MKTSPTQRSIKLLKAEGYRTWITEHWNPFARRRVDLFNFCDILAMKGDHLLAVQATSDNGGNVSARVAKIKAEQAASVWLECPTRKIVVHGWAKRGHRGKRKLWECRRIEITP